MIQIHDCEQGTADWYAVRAGKPTASEFHTVLAKGKDGGASVTRRAYLLKLAGEIITGQCSESYSNAHMERGKAMEEEARQRYAFERDAEPQVVGFIENGRKGASPDALLEANGLLEVKTKEPHRLIECLLRDSFPPEHRAQCQGALWVAEREWIDLAIYWPGMPLVIHRAVRDEAYIKTLAAGVDAFNEELDAVVARVRAYGATALRSAA